MSGYQTILISTVSAFIVAVLSAFITVNLSIRQFRTQKWWELKADAYSKIIEALSYMQYYYGEWFEYTADIKNLTESQRKDLSIKYNSAREAIVKASATGSYIISEESTDALNKLIRSLENGSLSGNLADQSDENYGIVRDCISILRENAKKELKK